MIHTYIYIYIYIYIYMCVCVCVCVYTSSTFADNTEFDYLSRHPSLPVGFLDCSQCLQRADVCKFLFVGEYHTHKHTHTLVYIYIYIYEVHTISFQTFFVWAFKIGVDTWKFSMLLLYILWDDWPIFMISASNEQIQQQLEYTLLKPDCHSWWISKMQSGRENTLEERYAMEFCFKLGKNATETYRMLQTAFRPSCMNRASVFEWHKGFKEDMESVRDGERCGRSKEVNTPQLIGLKG